MMFSDADRALAMRALQRLDMVSHALHRADELSGGQQQRVAIARALSHRPELLFADEPTGNLHDSLSRQVMSLLTRLVEEAGSSLLLVTHSREMAAFAGRRLLLEEAHLHAVD
jgi:putative ABC transport system ATP-binding protein